MYSERMMFPLSQVCHEESSSIRLVTEGHIEGRFLGYHHASGEVHILETGAWMSCPGKFSKPCISRSENVISNRISGQDNPSDQCIVGAVPNIFDGVSGDHAGPYDGVHMGC